MKDKVVNLANVKGDATLWTPAQLFEDALNDDEYKKYNKVISIFLKDTEDDYDIRFSQAGMSMSEILSVLEVAKTVVLSEMGYLPSQEEL